MRYLVDVVRVSASAANARPRCETACFSAARHLRKRASVAFGRHEHRVVAEPVLARRCRRDHALDLAPRRDLAAVGPARDMATVANRAVRNAGYTPSSSRSSLATLSA